MLDPDRKQEFVDAIDKLKQDDRFIECLYELYHQNRDFESYMCNRYRKDWKKRPQIVADQFQALADIAHHLALFFEGEVLPF